MKNTVTAIAATLGVAAAGVAVWSVGATREIATVGSLYGAFVVVVASYPGRRPVAPLAHRRARHI